MKPDKEGRKLFTMKANTVKSFYHKSSLLSNVKIAQDIYILEFAWEFTPPRAGQFFMLQPKAAGTFLPRPVSVYNYETGKKSVSFLVQTKGAGTKSFAEMTVGDATMLCGPLGNTFGEHLSLPSGKIALAGGGAGIAPLTFFAGVCAGQKIPFTFYAGFKSTPFGVSKNQTAPNTLEIVTEDGSTGRKGLITEYLDACDFSAVFACGPLPMLKAVAEKCRAAGTPCYVSMEQRMACGVGACLGCTITTKKGNKRCCKDGPIFNAEELFF
jgi:NAD(P)H-flavin reductase